jgi:hypothetical protein
MKNIQSRLSLFILLGIFSLTANAEYYMVYPASAVTSSNCHCVRHTRTYVSHTKHPRYKKSTHHYASHRRSSYHMDVYYIWYAYPGMVPVPPPSAPCCCGGAYRDYWELQSRYATYPVVYEHDDDATYYAPDLDRSTADDVDYAY